MKRQRPISTRRQIPAKRARRTSMPKRMPASFQPTGAEIKAIDIPEADYTYRATPTNGIFLLNGIQTGSGFFNRVGARVEMKNLHMRGSIRNTATSVSGFGRIMIVYDRQPVGALPNIVDIIQSRDQLGAATISGSSEINLDNRDRFIILRDYETYFPPVTNTAGVLTNGPNFPGEDNRLDVNVFLKLKGLGVHFKSSTVGGVTITDIATGALYACFVCDAAALDNTWKFTGSFRLRYDDK